MNGKPKPRFTIDQLVRSVFGTFADMGQVKFTCRELRNAIRDLSQGEAPHSQSYVSRYIDEWLEDGLIVVTRKRIVRRDGYTHSVVAYAVTSKGGDYWGLGGNGEDGDELDSIADTC